MNIQMQRTIGIRLDCRENMRDEGEKVASAVIQFTVVLGKWELEDLKDNQQCQQISDIKHIRGKKALDYELKKASFFFPSLPFTSGVILGKSLNCSENSSV